MSDNTTIMDPLGLEDHGSGNGNGGTAVADPMQRLVDGIDPESVAAELEDKSAEETLRWAIETFHPSLYVASSFQKTSSVIVDMATKIEPEMRFFYLDTDVLFKETYETRDKLEAKYGITFDRFHNISLEEQARLHGDELWKTNPDACCGLRKVDPMGEALSTVDCWVSGIRRGESQGRAQAPKFHWDKRFGLWKLNPLADWSDQDVWNYLSRNHVPYNPLHDQGYPSIGCTHCTRPVAEGEDERAGRWANSTKVECGLHDEANGSANGEKSGKLTSLHN
jgi:phosphoadenosine phosphosulfate reductase